MNNTKVVFEQDEKKKVQELASQGLGARDICRMISEMKKRNITKRMLYYRCGKELREGYALARYNGIELPNNTGKGGPLIEITQEDREQIKLLAGYGLRNDQIANVIGIGKMTLIAHCQEDLDVGRSSAIRDVARTLYKMATSGENPNETKFYLKTQAGWKEATQIEFPDENGRPQNITGPVTNINLSAEKMQTLIAMLNEQV